MAARKLTLTRLRLQAPCRALEQSIATAHCPRSPWPATECLGDTGREGWPQRHKPPVTKQVSPGVVRCSVVTIAATLYGSFEGC